MKKKLLYIFCLICIGNFTFSEDINKDSLKVNSESTTVTESFDDVNYPTENEINEFNANKPLKKPNLNFSIDTESVKDASSLGQKFDFNKMIDDIDNYWEVFDSGSEKFFKSISDASDSVTAASSIAGSWFGFGGIAVAGNNIQQIMQKVLMMKNRIDQLKQYKRFIDSIKSLSKSDLKSIAGMKQTLESIDKLVKEGAVIKDKTIGFSKELKKLNLSDPKAWEVLGNKEIDVRELNSQTLEKIAGESNKEIRDTIQGMKEKLNTINPKNENQNLQYLNQQMAILISLMEKQISDTSSVASAKIIADNKKLEEEIAAKEAKKSEVKKLQDEIVKINEKVTNMQLGKNFVGSVNGNR